MSIFRRKSLRLFLEVCAVAVLVTIAPNTLSATNEDGLFCACIHPATELETIEHICADVGTTWGYTRTRTRTPRNGDVYVDHGPLPLPDGTNLTSCTSSIDTNVVCIEPFSVKGPGREAYVCVGSPSQPEFRY